MKNRADRISFLLFMFSVTLSAFIYGLAAGVYQLFPFSYIYKAKHAFDRVTNRTEYYLQVEYKQADPIFRSEGACPGINLVTCVTGDDRLSAKLIDMDGHTLHEWMVDWFELWGDAATHLRESKVPKSRPGTHIHGAVVMDNGDLVFNFEELGLVRLDRDGRVVWRLPYQTHHAVHLDEDGQLWVCGLKHRNTTDPAYPNYLPPYHEYTVLEVSDEGEILREISVFDLFKRNNRQGLLYMSTLNKRITEVDGDTLHLNDVEVYPSSLPPGVFAAGDVMISLRNIHTIIVFDPDTLHIKWASTGRFVRQHDPDFIDGNTISVFDNNNTGTRFSGTQSRIVKLTAADDELTVAFEGSEAFPFFSDIMGKHQWLPNGNLLITESVGGRAFEIDSRGEVVWQYINYVRPGVVGIVQEVTRLPAEKANVYVQAEPR